MEWFILKKLLDWKGFSYQKSLIMKDARNAEYLAMIDRGIAQLSAGKGQEHELIEMDK